MSDITTRKGKIARLPKRIRDQVNLRLLNNEPGSTILPWLNELPEVQSMLAEHFRAEPINDQNLSAWRTGGFAQWMQQQDELERTRSRSQHALDLVKAGGHHISDGLAAIIAGDVLEDWEAASDEEDKDAAIKKLLALRVGDHVRAQIELQKEKLKLDQDKHGLNEKKFKMLAVKKFMEWAREPSAQSILTSGKPKDVQMSLLHELLWGKAPAEGSTDGE